MIQTKYLCDYCGEPLKVHTKIILGIEVEVVETARTQELDSSRILPHLHKECAGKIDYELLKAKQKLLDEIAANNPKLKKIRERSNIT